MSKEDKAKSGSLLQASVDEEPQITQHFFFFTKRKPVLKEKKTCFFLRKVF